MDEEDYDSTGYIKEFENFEKAKLWMSPGDFIEIEGISNKILVLAKSPCFGYHCYDFINREFFSYGWVGDINRGFCRVSYDGSNRSSGLSPPVGSSYSLDKFNWIDYED